MPNMQATLLLCAAQEIVARAVPGGYRLMKRSLPVLLVVALVLFACGVIASQMPLSRTSVIDALMDRGIEVDCDEDGACLIGGHNGRILIYNGQPEAEAALIELVSDDTRLLSVANVIIEIDASAPDELLVLVEDALLSLIP